MVLPGLRAQRSHPELAGHEVESARTQRATGPTSRPRLTNGLPGWFTQLDRDRDGQIGLFEWKHGRLPTELFQRLDLNDDGFITPEELLRHLACGRDRAAIFRLKVPPDDPSDDDDDAQDPDPS